MTLAIRKYLPCNKAKLYNIELLKCLMSFSKKKKKKMDMSYCTSRVPIWLSSILGYWIYEVYIFFVDLNLMAATKIQSWKKMLKILLLNSEKNQKIWVGNWIYIYLCNQYIPPLKLWVWFTLTVRYTKCMYKFPCRNQIFYFNIAFNSHWTVI